MKAAGSKLPAAFCILPLTLSVGFDGAKGGEDGIKMPFTYKSNAIRQLHSEKLNADIPR